MKKLSTLILLTLFGFSCSNTPEDSMNPFFEDYDAPYQIPPFEKDNGSPLPARFHSRHERAT